MSLLTIPINPLGKIYTLKSIVNTVLLWLKKEQQSELEPEFVKTLSNLAIMDVTEITAEAGSDDYGQVANLTDVQGSVTTGTMGGADYTNVDRKIFLLVHGLTVNDIGKRIVLWKATRAGIAEVESIIDVNNFTITKPFGINVSDHTLGFAVLPAHSSTTISLSAYKLSSIAKLTSSTVKEIIKVGDREFDNLHRFDEKQNKIFWYKHGQSLFLYVGTSVTNPGDINMYYNSYPQLHILDNELLDIRDYYIPLVVLKTKNFCLEHLGLTAPESLTSLIDEKVKQAKDNILREKGMIAQKNQRGIDG